MAHTFSIEMWVEPIVIGKLCQLFVEKWKKICTNGFCWEKPEKGELKRVVTMIPKDLASLPVIEIKHHEKGIIAVVSTNGAEDVFWFPFPKSK